MWHWLAWLIAWLRANILGNLVANVIWAAPALWQLHRKLNRHHREQMGRDDAA